MFEAQQVNTMTFKSPRPRKNAKRIAARAHGLKRWRAADEAERLARPYISLAPAPGELIRRVIVQDTHGECVIECRVPIVPARSDQMAVTVDGTAEPQLCGVTALLAVIGRRLPKQPSRAAVRRAEIDLSHYPSLAARSSPLRLA
jgi:hypothetical protein